MTFIHRPDEPDKITIDFGGRRHKETRWTKYRRQKLIDLGFSDWEILALKYNKLTNPRVKWLLRDIKREVKDLQTFYNLSSYTAAAQYRRDNFEDLVDSGEIEEADPYRRMGYDDEY